MPREVWDNWTPERRLESAAARIDKIIDRAAAACRLHETNRIVAYGNPIEFKTGWQAEGHRETRHHLFMAELTLLCPIWDAPREHRNSLPTVAALIDQPDVFELIESGFNANSRAESMRGVRIGLDAISQIADSPEMKSIVAHRNAHIAHSLSEEAKDYDIKVKYGDESIVLEKTLPTIDIVNLAVRRSGFAWDSATNNGRKIAEAFWNNIRMEGNH
jgi:hypothetical protein